MNVMKQQIKKMFTNLKELKEDGIHFSGEEYKGEYKRWDNGRLWFHCFYIEKGKREGEYKQWHHNGKLWIHCFFNGKGKYRDEYKEWDESGTLWKHEIYNKDGSLKEKIV